MKASVASPSIEKKLQGSLFQASGFGIPGIIIPAQTAAATNVLATADSSTACAADDGDDPSSSRTVQGCTDNEDNSSVAESGRSWSLDSSDVPKVHKAFAREDEELHRLPTISPSSSSPATPVSVTRKSIDLGMRGERYSPANASPVTLARQLLAQQPNHAAQDLAAPLLASPNPSPRAPSQGLRTPCAVVPRSPLQAGGVMATSGRKIVRRGSLFSNSEASKDSSSPAAAPHGTSPIKAASPRRRGSTAMSIVGVAIEASTSTSTSASASAAAAGAGGGDEQGREDHIRPADVVRCVEPFKSPTKTSILKSLGVQVKTKRIYNKRSTEIESFIPDTIPEDW